MDIINFVSQRDTEKTSEVKRQTKCGNSSVGRASPCQGGGREFESRFPLHTNAEIAQLVEHHLAKVGVASSSLVFRSILFVSLM